MHYSFYPGYSHTSYSPNYFPVHARNTDKYHILAKRDQLISAIAFSTFASGLTFFSCLSTLLYPYYKNPFSIWNPELSLTLSIISFVSTACLHGIAYEAYSY